VARTPDIRPLGDCNALVSWSEGDLSGAWDLRQANHETGQRSAGEVEGHLVPEVVPPTEPAELVLSLTPTVGAGDLGVSAIRVEAAAGFAFDGEATLDVDGVPTEGASLIDVDTLVFTLDVPVTEDGASLGLRFRVIPPDAPQSATTFQAWLEHAEAGCPTAVDDNLWIAVEEAGDDDDVSGDDDSTPADDDDCSCRSDGGSAAAGAGAAFLLAAAAAFGLRRRSGTRR
jgi:MYXO-CTERM domain-containing protein